MSEETESEEQEQSSAIRAVGMFFWELIKAFLIAMAIIIPIRYYLVQPFFVRGASMEPTFDNGEYLVIDQLSYRFRGPTRGEVIVFRYPGQRSQFFIKRIVGLPGENIKIQNGQVVIGNNTYPQGVVLDESVYLDDIRTGGSVDTQLGAEEYFVLGDNRSSSSDSRSWGSLRRSDIVGRAWIRAYPFDRFDVFTPERLGLLNV